MYMSNIFETLKVSVTVNKPLSKIKEITSSANKNRGIETTANIKKHTSVCFMRAFELLNLFVTSENIGNKVLEITRVPNDTKKEKVL